MDADLSQIKTKVYDACGFEFSDFKLESESKEYNACTFKLNNKRIISRNAKITPKKVGQFVTFWKRNENGSIEPFNKSDQIDFYSVTVRFKDRLGLFIFPKSILVQKGIISTEKKEGKRGFRVYPDWDIAQNTQAIKTQKWQLNYFYEVQSSVAIEKVSALYALE